MHHRNILHRDIKTDNILILDDKNIKVCFADFGFACKTNDTEKLKKACGTPGFIDPAVLKGGTHSSKSDIFSLGCLFFSLISGKYLYNGATFEEVLEKNKKNNPINYVRYSCEHASKECCSLLERMLDIDLGKRPTAKQCLNHSWF